MKQIKSKTIKSVLPKKNTALNGVSLKTTSTTVLGAAAVGFAGYLLWKNRGSIRTFVGKYIDASETPEIHDPNK